MRTSAASPRRKQEVIGSSQTATTLAADRYETLPLELRLLALGSCGDSNFCGSQIFNHRHARHGGPQAGAGDDRLEVNDVCAVDNFFAKLGDGNDVATINDLYIINKKAQIDAGSGNDSLTRTGAFPTAAQTTLSNFEWINGRPVLVANLPVGATSVNNV